MSTNHLPGCRAVQRHGCHGYQTGGEVYLAVPQELLNPRPRGQRDSIRSHARSIAKRWDWRAVVPPLVSFNKSSGRFDAADSGHTIEAHRIRFPGGMDEEGNPQPLMCKLAVGPVHELFRIRNTGRKNPNRTHLFWSEYDDGCRANRRVVKLLNDNGIPVVRHCRKMAEKPVGYTEKPDGFFEVYKVVGDRRFPLFLEQYWGLFLSKAEIEGVQVLQTLARTNDILEPMRDFVQSMTFPLEQLGSALGWIDADAFYEECRQIAKNHHRGTRTIMTKRWLREAFV